MNKPEPELDVCSSTNHGDAIYENDQKDLVQYYETSSGYIDMSGNRKVKYVKTLHTNDL